LPSAEVGEPAPKTSCHQPSRVADKLDRRQVGRSSTRAALLNRTEQRIASIPGVYRPRSAFTAGPRSHEIATACARKKKKKAPTERVSPSRYLCPGSSDKPQRIPNMQPAIPTTHQHYRCTSRYTDSVPVGKCPCRSTASSLRLLSVCCSAPPLLGSSYPPYDSNTPKIIPSSSSLRFSSASRASAARANPNRARLSDQRAQTRQSVK